MLSRTRSPGMPISARCTTSSTETGRRTGVDHTGLQPGQVQQVGQQVVQLVGGGGGRGEQFGLVGVGPGDAAVAQAGDGRLDGGQRGAQVVGQRGQHGGADLVPLPQSFALFGLLGQPVPFDRQDGLRGEHLDQPPVRRRQRLPVHGQHPARIRRSGRDQNVGGVGVHGVPEFGGDGGRRRVGCGDSAVRPGVPAAPMSW